MHAMGEGPVSLRVEGLTLCRGAHCRLRALDLTVEPGQIVGLLGPNGAGKSTAFSLIAGVQPASAGKVWWNQENLSDIPLYQRVRRGVAYLPQGPSVITPLTALENLQLAPVSPSRALNALETAGLAAIAHRPAGLLSGGERRRLELARAFLGDPTLLLLDEPWAGLDPIHAEALRGEVRAFAARGGAVLLTDHAARATLAWVDEAVILWEGQVRARGTGAQVAQRPDVQRDYLGFSSTGWSDII